MYSNKTVIIANYANVLSGTMFSEKCPSIFLIGRSI